MTYDLPIPSRLVRLELCMISVCMYEKEELALALSNVKVLCFSNCDAWEQPVDFSKLVRWLSGGKCAALNTLIRHDLQRSGGEQTAAMG